MVFWFHFVLNNLLRFYEIIYFARPIVDDFYQDLSNGYIWIIFKICREWWRKLRWLNNSFEFEIISSQIDSLQISVCVNIYVVFIKRKKIEENKCKNWINYWKMWFVCCKSITTVKLDCLILNKRDVLISEEDVCWELITIIFQVLLLILQGMSCVFFPFFH